METGLNFESHTENEHFSRSERAHFSRNKWLEMEILFGKAHSRQTLAIEKPESSDEGSFQITGIK